MEKLVLYGKIVYSISRAEKCRFNTKKRWNKKHKTEFIFSMNFLYNIINCMLTTEINDNDNQLIKEIVALIKDKKLYYLYIDNDKFLVWENSNYSISSTIHLTNEHQEVNRLMLGIIKEITSMMNKSVKMNKKIIWYDLMALHNLSRVYLYPSNDEFLDSNFPRLRLTCKEAIDIANDWLSDAKDERNR